MKAFVLAMLVAAPAFPQVKFVGKTKYLNNARAVVTHTFDDSNLRVIDTLDALDKYGVKATAFVSTARSPIEKLWDRLRLAVDNGHEVGSHSRQHQCKWPADAQVCSGFISDGEVAGSRDDIVRNTQQKYVWSWCYPCGLCADLPASHAVIRSAGYLVGRNYPGEEQDLHNVPNLQTWASNPFNAAYTQVVQKKGGIAKSGRTDVAELNAKFDEVHKSGGIYHFLSHPAWLDFGSDAFYERHLAHIAKRSDVWYVPLGPLYAYPELRDKTEVKRLNGRRYAVTANVDRKVYDGSVTLEFDAGRAKGVLIDGKPAPERTSGLTDHWRGAYFRRDGGRVFVTLAPGSTVEFR